MRLRETLVRPRGAAAGRPLLVFLHGRGMGEDGMLSRQMFAALAAQGDRAPDIVFPDGGDHSYWHDRHGAAWGRYVMNEVIPQAIKRLGADPSRVAIGGISMGGFGAFDLARLHPHRFCAVGGHSPALWTSEPPPCSMAGCQILSRADRRCSNVSSSWFSTSRTKPARSACRMADSRRSVRGMVSEEGRVEPFLFNALTD